MLLNLTLLLGLLFVVGCLPHHGLRPLRLFDRLLGRMAQDPTRAVALVAVTAFVVPAAIAWLGRIPLPRVQDEFSYLLAADTFAHGRLSNPAHPLWIHFESMHIIQQPTYASKYPPAQGLALALGQITAGHPIFGVWLSTALASAAVCWMLFAWLPPRWALLGGLLTAVHPAMLHWSQGYWGGAVAVLGGALLLGSWRRLLRRPCARDAFGLAAGIAVLANSRPLEGFVLTIVALVPLLARLVGPAGPPWRESVTRVIFPGGLVLAVAAGAMGYYNWRITGHPLRMPYAVHEAEYSVAPPLVFQSRRAEPVYRHKELRDLYVGWALRFYDEQHDFGGFCRSAVVKVAGLCEGFLPLLALQVPLLAIPWMRKDRWSISALRFAAVFLAALSFETWMHPHYAAPALPLAILIAIQAMQQLRLLKWRGRPAGLFLVRGALILSIVALVSLCQGLSRQNSEGWSIHRARAIEHLAKQDGGHLVIVRYSTSHSPHEEWVYNEADVDNAKVVWARDMGVAGNRELIEYFADRHVWLIEADEREPQVVVYLPEMPGP
jgi:hypothetical protein